MIFATPEVLNRKKCAFVKNWEKIFNYTVYMSNSLCIDAILFNLDALISWIFFYFLVNKMYVKISGKWLMLKCGFLNLKIIENWIYRAEVHTSVSMDHNDILPTIVKVRHITEWVFIGMFFLSLTTFPIKLLLQWCGEHWIPLGGEWSCSCLGRIIKRKL